MVFQADSYDLPNQHLNIFHCYSTSTKSSHEVSTRRSSILTLIDPFPARRILEWNREYLILAPDFTEKKGVFGEFDLRINQTNKIFPAVNSRPSSLWSVVCYPHTELTRVGQGQYVPLIHRNN